MCHESINNKPGRLADRQALTAMLPEHRGMAGRESCRMQMRLQMQDRASRQAHDSRARSYPVQIMIALAVAGG